jgi:hypothetical protein
MCDTFLPVSTTPTTATITHPGGISPLQVIKEAPTT